MKKNFLFKWVAMLGTISLLANTLLPGLAHATDFIAVTPNGDIDKSGALNEVYNFVSYATDKKTVYGTGSVKVLNKGTVVNVTENYLKETNVNPEFLGHDFVVRAVEVPAQKLPIYAGVGSEEPLPISVLISNSSEAGTNYDFVSYEGNTDNEWWNGKVEILEQWTVVIVEENYKYDDSDEFVWKNFYVSKSECVLGWNPCIVYSKIEGETPTAAWFYVKIISWNDENGYEFVSYADAEWNRKWWDGKVTLVESDNEKYEKIIVSKNFKLEDESASSFVGKKYIVKAIENTKEWYELYSLNGEDAGIYVKILEGSNTDWYEFVAYDPADKTKKWWDGKVTVDYQYTKVRVTENYKRYDWGFEWQNFVVYETENGWGKYPLYTTKWNFTGVYIAVSSGDAEDQYNFVSYGDENWTKERWKGKVNVVGKFTTVIVTANYPNDSEAEKFVGNKYVIYKTELLDPDTTFYELYETNGSSANIFVKIDAYTVTFNSNGGSEIAEQIVAEWAKIKKPTNPEKEGYTFDKWYSDEALTKEWNFDSDTVNKNVTLYAKWNQNQSSSSSSRSSWWGGGSRTTTTKTTETKANTWDTAKVDNAKTDNKVTDNNTNDNTKTPAYNDKYSKEFNDAYQFAYKNGITTMPSIEEADMEWTLTRIAMAKMLSQYAINVLGKTPDTSKVVPTFPDVTAQMDADYNNGVTLAYQLWIMWIGIDKFRPDDLVTRAEFATALSRLLFNTPDGEWAYYETHLAKLMEEKIITNNNPDLQELRGYVMIMLMRSAQS